MTEPDLLFITQLLRKRVVSGSVLELGTGYGGATCREAVQGAGLIYYGTDVEPGDSVDFVADFERSESLAVFDPVQPFGSIFILNVLEHTFDPIRILDNALTLLRPGGKLIVLTPAIWPLHNYPIDVWRTMPGFYEVYASRKGLELLKEHFEYVGFGPVAGFRNADSTDAFPRPGSGLFHAWYSRIVHWLFKTFGRGMLQPSHIAIGAVMVKPARAA